MTIKPLHQIHGSSFSNYIENLIFAEFMSQLLGIGETNTLIIHNSLYKLYVPTMREDIEHGVDLVLKDQQGKLIGIDITKSKKIKPAILKAIDVDNYKSKIVLNYFIHVNVFKAFFRDYMRYVFENGTKPILDDTRNYEQIRNYISTCIDYHGEQQWSKTQINHG